MSVLVREQAANTIKRAWKSWQLRLEGRLMRKQMKEGYGVVSIKQQREILELRMYQANAEKEIRRKDAEITVLGRLIASLQESLKLLSERATEQDTLSLQSESLVGQLQARMASQAKVNIELTGEMKNLQSDVANLQAALTLKSSSNAALISRNDDLALEREEAKLLTQQLAIRLKDQEEDMRALANRAQMLEREMTATNRAMARASEYIRLLQAKENAGTVSISQQQLDDVSGVLLVVSFMVRFGLKLRELFNACSDER
jgi:chromosome segregation ATPase